MVVFFFSSRRRHTRWPRDWSSDVCSSDLVLLGAVALEAGRELGGPVRDLLCTFGQSRLLLAAADPVGEQLCALAELGGAVGDVLGGGDQAGILGRPVAGDDRCGLVHSAGELLQSGGQLIGAGLQPRVLGGAVPLLPGGQLLRTVEETGLGLGAVHPGLQGDHALSEVLVAGGQLVQPGGQLIAAGGRAVGSAGELIETVDRKSTRLNSSHVAISYAVFC